MPLLQKGFRCSAFKHAETAVETAADHTGDEADDAALRRALTVLTNVEGDLAELDALAAERGRPDG